MAIHRVRYGEAFPASCRSGALTIGNFDGVHLGHQALLGELCAQAALVQGPAVAMIFDPAPSQLLRPETHPAALTTQADRVELMHRHGASHVVVMQTTLELLRHTAREFFTDVIHRGAAAKTVVPGFNFAFGRGREGTVEVLNTLCQEVGMACVPASAFVIDGSPVSSSRIRADLLVGKITTATRLLGRPYRVEGTVGAGAGRGQKLGFPTANLGAVPVLVPGDGVYAVRVTLGGQTHAGAANVGANPTFGENVRKIEVHMLDFAGDLYGATLSVEFLDRLRDTRKFAGVEELLVQLRVDVAAARRVCNSFRMPQVD
jgi:riboflavin kinase/FMN adenylyltransferase